MNTIVQNAIAATRGVVNDASALSGYNIYWIYIKPVGGGIVTEADKKKLYRGGRLSFISFPNEKEIKYAVPKDKYNDEVARLKGIKGLSKAMRVTYITDKQFGRKMGPTQKQQEGSFVIGNSGVADGTVANALAAHRAKNDAEGEKAVNADGDEEREAKFVQGVKFDADRCKTRVNDTIRKCLDHVVYYVKQEVVSCDYYIKMINKDISDCSKENQASLMSILTIFENCAKKCEFVISKVKAIKV